MNESQKLLSEIVIYDKYAKYIPDLKRRETWSEVIDRYSTMMIEKYGNEGDYLLTEVSEMSPLAQEIHRNTKSLLNKDVLPSMRALQFAGKAIKKNNARIYNCAYLPIEDHTCFSEIMFLLLGGTGCGYSVQKHHVNKLPPIIQPEKDKKFLIGDSIEGWADAVKALMKSYFGKTKYRPRFDYSDIRKKGERLVTAGGKAPGPEPLRLCLTKIDSLLRQIPNNQQLTPLQCHDIVCHIADSVLAGGIRRAALISLFSKDDVGMLTCKSGKWWELNPQRGRANNSVSLDRSDTDKDEFIKLWGFVKNSGAGEPGIYWTTDRNYGTNPCCEISLMPYQFCNLTEINAGTILTGLMYRIDHKASNKGEGIKSDNGVFWRQLLLNERVKIAAFFGTLQAGFTDFHYLRPVWKRNTEKDALIGVGITGICNGNILDLDLKQAAQIAKDENERVAKLIGINPSSRCTTVKPSGSTSCVVGTSSGIHAWHSKYYIRNMQCAIGSELYNYFKTNHPHLIEDMKYQLGSAVIGIPQKAPIGAILREDEDALGFLNRVQRFNKEWVREGHRTGPNFNNVSATCSILDNKGEELSEWGTVGEWMWDNRNEYNGLSVLPYDGGTYENAPFQECTKEEYEEKMNYIRNNPINLSLIIEDDDNTSRRDSIACAGGGCEI